MSNRKNWVRYSALVLFCIGAFGLINYTLSLTFITWGTAFLLFVWDNQTDKHEKRVVKKEYISNFPEKDLCFSLKNLNLVYKIIERNDDTYKIQPIWSGESPSENAKVYTVKTNEVMPFDMELFLNLT